MVLFFCIDILIWVDGSFPIDSDDEGEIYDTLWLFRPYILKADFLIGRY